MSSPTVDVPTALPPKAARNPIRVIIPLLLLAAAGYWGFTRWSFGRGHESTDNAQVDGQIVPVVAKVGGYVTAVSAGENGHVASDAVLVRIDEREYAVKLAQADADLAAARASVGGAVACRQVGRRWSRRAARGPTKRWLRPGVRSRELCVGIERPDPQQ